MKKLSKLMSLVLALAMCLSLLPATALAANTVNEPDEKGPPSVSEGGVLTFTVDDEIVTSLTMRPGESKKITATSSDENYSSNFQHNWKCDGLTLTYNDNSYSHVMNPCTLTVPKTAEAGKYTLSCNAGLHSGGATNSLLSARSSSGSYSGKLTINVVKDTEPDPGDNIEVSLGDGMGSVDITADTEVTIDTGNGSTTTATVNNDFTLPDPGEKDGYEFTGWEYDEDSKTFTAQWKATETTPSGTYSISLSPSSANIVPGGTVTVTVNLTGDSITGASAVISYDTSVFDYTSGAVKAGNGSVEVASESAGKNGVIGAVTFTAKSADDLNMEEINGAFSITSNAVNYVADGSPLTKTDGTATGCSVVVNNKFTVTLDAGEKGTSDSSFDVKYGTELNETILNAHKATPNEGTDTFVKWMYNGEDALGVTVTENIQLTA